MQKSILVLHGGALGDCVLVIPFVRTLQAPTHRVTLAARSSIARWAAARGLIDEAISLDAYLNHPKPFDVVVSLLGGPDEAISHELRRAIGQEIVCLDPRPLTSSRTHIVDQWLSRWSGRSRGRKPADTTVEFTDENARTTLVARTAADQRPIVLIHPGSGGLSKCVPLDTLAPLIPAFRCAGWTPAWMIGPDERERFGDSYEGALSATAPVIYEESVVNAADLVSTADAYIGMDAGMTHVAAIAGVNTLALFGASDPEVWRPLGPSVQVLDFAALHDPLQVVGCVLRTNQTFKRA